MNFPFLRNQVISLGTKSTGFYLVQPVSESWRVTYYVDTTEKEVFFDRKSIVPNSIVLNSIVLDS